MGRLFALFAAALSLSACASLPESPSSRGLYVDLRKAVELRESLGWYADRLEVEQLVPGAMRSLCQTPPAARDDLRTWIDTQIAELGGPAREAYVADGRRRTARVDRLLRLERVRAVLDGAAEHADDCPFWLPADENFEGDQGDSGRFVILAESGGGFGAHIGQGAFRLGGGGAGRLLFGAGLDGRWTLAAGLEVGGAGVLTATDEGTTLVARFQGAVPLLVRLADGLRIYDAEVALTTRWQDETLRMPPGVRVTVGGGLASLRVGSFMPTGVLTLGYEYVPPSGDSAAEHIIRVGTRVGFDWDP